MNFYSTKNTFKQAFEILDTFEVLVAVADTVEDAQHAARQHDGARIFNCDTRRWVPVAPFESADHDSAWYARA